ncbi:MAG: dihydroorotate dehydrogenase electron transfer subunit [Syntrophales bacterium]
MEHGPVSPRSLVSARIEANREISPGFFLMSIIVPEEYLAGNPGQFVMIRVKGIEAPLLGRPLSIHSLYPEGSRIICEFLYQVVGKGTSLLSGLNKGNEVLIMGPLGRGFSIIPDIQNVILIAGGMGIAPLTYLAQHYRMRHPGTGIICYWGARTKEVLVDLERLRKSCAEIRVSTDDGSCGFRGSVTELFMRDMDRYPSDTAVYICGPVAMLKALKSALRNRFPVCEVSVEERMACGIGACLGCAVRVEGGAYKKACKDGPVFSLSEVVCD